MKLILHADDFGMNCAVNDGIIKGFSEGLLTSTSLLANAPRAAAAIDEWKKLEERRRSGDLPSFERRKALGDPDCPFDLGLHLNLTQGRPMTDGYPPALLDAQGRFPGIFRLYGRLLRDGRRWKEPLARELHCQIDLLESRSVHPTHLNGHQYCEMLPVVREIIPELLTKHGIGTVRVAAEWYWKNSIFWQRLGPIPWLLGGLKQHYARQFRNRCKILGLESPDAFFGSMLAGRVDLRRVTAFLGRATSCRSAEICLHPGSDLESGLPEDGWADPLAAVRSRELVMLKSNELYDLLKTRSMTLSRLGLPASAEAS